MSWEIVRLDKGLGDYRLDWDRLNLELFSGQPFFDSRFIDLLLECFGSCQERLCIHTNVEGAVDGLIILVKRRIGTWSLFLPSQAQIAPVLVKNCDDLSSLFYRLPGFAVVLEFLNQDPLFTIFQTEQNISPQYCQSQAVTININIDCEFDLYWKGRSKNLRQNLKRYMNRIEREGGDYRFEAIEKKMDFFNAIRRYGDLESRGWKEKEGTAIHIDNIQGVFYQSLLNTFSESFEATIYELYIGEKIASSRLCIRNGSMLIILKTAYDEASSKFAPGRILLYLLLEREFALRRVSSVEFYTNATSDQIAWSTGQRTISHVMLFRSSLFYSIYRFFKDRCADRVSREDIGINSRLASTELYSIKIFKELQEAPSSYRTLFTESAKQSFDLGLDWFSHLSETSLFSGWEVVFFGLEQERSGTAEAILPLMKKHGGHELTSLTTFYTSLFHPIVREKSDQNVLKLLFEGIRKNSQRYDLINLQPMANDGQSYEMCYQAFRRAGWIPFRYFCFGNWYLTVGERSYNQYYASLPSSLRHIIERKSKRFYNQENGRIEIFDSEECLEEATTAYDKIYRLSWKVQEPFPKFIPGLLRMCASKGELRLGIAYVDQEPAAAQIWIVSYGRAAIYKLAYDEKFSKLSIGTILTNHMMRHVIEIDKVNEVDYLIGDDAYKRGWMSHRRERWGIIAYNPRTLRGVWGISREFFGRTIKSVMRWIKRKSITL